MASGVYLIRNTKNGKCQVGSSKNILQRWRYHRTHLADHTHPNVKMQLDYDLDGVDAFEYSIILECDEGEARKQECIYIDTFDCINNGYNAIPDKKNADLLRNKEKTYIQSYLAETDYRPDGNYYVFDYFVFVNKVHSTPTKFMHSLGIDSERRFPIYAKYDDIFVGVDVIAGELVVIVTSNIEIDSPEFIYERDIYGN